jgi:hypothetical protein
LEGKHQRGDAEGGKGGKQEPGFHDFADRIAGIARTLLTKFWRCIFAGKTGATCDRLSLNPGTPGKAKFIVKVSL